MPAERILRTALQQNIKNQANFSNFKSEKKDTIRSLSPQLPSLKEIQWYTLNGQLSGKLHAECRHLATMKGEGKWGQKGGKAGATIRDGGVAPRYLHCDLNHSQQGLNFLIKTPFVRSSSQPRDGRTTSNKAQVEKRAYKLRNVHDSNIPIYDQTSNDCHLN